MENQLFGIVKICNLVHDEVVCEFPENMPDIPEKVNILWNMRLVNIAQNYQFQQIMKLVHIEYINYGMIYKFIYTNFF